MPNEEAEAIEAQDGPTEGDKELSSGFDDYKDDGDDSTPADAKRVSDDDEPEPDPEPEKEPDTKDKDDSTDDEDEPGDGGKKTPTAAAALESEVDKLYPGDDKAEPAAVPPGGKSDGDEPGGPPPPPDSPRRIKLTKEDIARHLGALDLDALPGEVIVGNETVDLKKYRSEFPEDFNNLMVMAAAIAEGMGGKGKADDSGMTASEKRMLATENRQLDRSFRSSSFKTFLDQMPPDARNFAKSESIEERRAVQDAYDGYMDYWNTVAEIHEDGMEITMTPGFTAWLGEQPAKVQRAANSGGSDMGIKIIDAYKESIAKSRVSAHDKKAADAKQRKDDILSDTTRNKTSPRKTSGKDPNDMSAGFDEYTDDDML